MRTITRSQTPPSCLAEQERETRWGAFARSQCHGEVKRSLMEKQYFLCCYCESEIGEHNSHIEHMEPQSTSSHRKYDYANLSASCDGGNAEHCGHFKDDHHRNPGYRFDSQRFCPPHSSGAHRLFKYLQNGDVVPASELTEEERRMAEYMIGYLGLQSPRLAGRRRSHARQLLETLGMEPQPQLTAWLRNRYLCIDHDGHLSEYNSLFKAMLQPWGQQTRAETGP